MDKRIEIYIAGTTGCGKTTIGLLIEKCLKENGFNASFYDDVVTRDELLVHQNERLEIIKDRDVKLAIRPFRMMRSAINNEST